MSPSIVSSKNMIKHYFQNAVFRVKHRSVVLWSCVVATAIIIVIHVLRPKQILQLDSSIELRISALVVLTITLCYSVESRYVASTEYKYFRSLPMPRALRFLSIIIRLLPFSNALALLIILNIKGPSRNLLLIPFINLLTLFLSTAIYHCVNTIRKVARRVTLIKYGMSTIFSVLFLCFSAVVLQTPKEEMRSFISEASGSLVCIFSSLHIGILLISLVWFAVFYNLKQPYEVVTFSWRSSMAVKNRPVYRALLPNLIIKDALTSIRVPIVMVFFTAQLMLGIYLAYNHVDSSVSTVFLITTALITSTLTEKLLEDETTMRAILRTLPVDLKRYFWTRIWSASIVLAMPSLLSLLLQVPFSNFRLYGLLLSALAIFAVVFLWCGMQCSVILSNLSNGNVQTQLTYRVLLSVIFPMFPLLSLLSRYRKAILSYCEE